MYHPQAYVKNGKVHIIGVVNSPAGVFPFAYHLRVPVGVPDGTVNLKHPSTPALKSAIIGAEAPIKRHVTKEALKLAAENLVERARQGDQNAIAMIVMVRKCAQKGRKRAASAFVAIKQYIDTHPVGPLRLVEIGAEPKTSLVSKAANAGNASYAAKVAAFVPTGGSTIEASKLASTVLANGKAITKADVASVASTFSGKAKEAFAYAYANALTPSVIVQKVLRAGIAEKRAAQIGYTLSMAHRLQQARLPNTSISIFNVGASWELGEPVTKSSEFTDADGTRPPIPDAIKSKNISKAGIVPQGFKRYAGINASVTSKAVGLLKRDFGYEEFATINGLDYFFRIEPHYHPAGYQGGPSGWHKGCTVYVKIVTSSTTLSENLAHFAPEETSEFAKNLKA